MERRNFLVGGAAGVAALSFGAQGASGHIQKIAATPPPLNRNLKGDFLDLTTPEGNREAMARFMGNTDMQSTKYGWFEGVVYGVRPNEKNRELFGFSGFSCTKLLPNLDGAPGYRKILREVAFYTDLETGNIIEEWTNPYLNETVKVVPIANDPFNFIITGFVPQPPKYGGLNLEEAPEIPLHLDWSRRGDLLNLNQRVHLFYPAALQPNKWPRESNGPMNRVTETFMYQIDWNEMQDPNVGAVKTNGSWSRITPWLPWMLMGPTEGHCVYNTFMGSGSSLDIVNPKILEYAERHFPKYLKAPDVWEEPSLSSLEHYALEQKPAPLPADGEVPFAPTADPMPFS